MDNVVYGKKDWDMTEKVILKGIEEEETMVR